MSEKLETYIQMRERHLAECRQMEERGSVPDTAREVARGFVAKLLKDAAAPHTGSFATDAEAWPSSGIDGEELVDRIALALKTAEVDARKAEAEWWSDRLRVSQNYTLDSTETARLAALD